jgi:hypothetical protein
MGFFDDVGGFFTHTLPGVVSGAFDVGKEVVNTAWSGAKSGVSDVWGGVKGGANLAADIAGKVADKGLNAFEGFSNILSNPILIVDLLWPCSF